jgi:TPR repeat protein
MALRRAQRLGVLGCGFRGSLVWLMSLGMDRRVQPQKRCKVHLKMMHAIAMRVIAGQAAAAAADVAREADELGASGQCAAAVVALQLAVDLGHMPSRAALADMLYHGREGVPTDFKRGLRLAKEGARWGCHHCKGVMANIRWANMLGSSQPQPLVWARESASKGSKFGQYVLGEFYQNGRFGLKEDFAAAVAHYQLAVAQNYCEAQYDLGWLYDMGIFVEQNFAEAMRLYTLAAAQGFAMAMTNIGELYIYGQGVAQDRAGAIRWFERAHAAGCVSAADRMRECLKELDRGDDDDDDEEEEYV